MERHFRKCQGTVKSGPRKGEPCDRWAIKGGTVCPVHGGSAGQVKRAAARNLTLARAQRMVELAGVDMDPIAHLLDCLHRAAALVNVWGIMVAALDDVGQEEADADGRLRGELRYAGAPEDSYDELAVSTNERLLGFNYRGEATIHPFVAEYNQALERRAKFAKMCVDAGVSERQIQLAERLGEQLSALFERTMAAIEGLSEEQRLMAARAYAREIAALERPAIDGTARSAT